MSTPLSCKLQLVSLILVDFCARASWGCPLIESAVKPVTVGHGPIISKRCLYNTQITQGQSHGPSQEKGADIIAGHYALVDIQKANVMGSVLRSLEIEGTVFTCMLQYWTGVR